MTVTDARTSGRWPGVRAAEHGAAQLLDRTRVSSACTHVAGGEVLVSVQEADGSVRVLGDPPPDAGEQARALHAERLGGRLFVFEGQSALTGVLPVGEVLARSAVDEVVLIGTREPVPATSLIDTQSFVRPHLGTGRVTLVVRPAAGGLVVPFEQPNPTPCCAEH